LNVLTDETHENSKLSYSNTRPIFQICDYSCAGAETTDRGLNVQYVCAKNKQSEQQKKNE